MESWAVWSILVVLVGMAGFWGGVLQHAHLSAGDGGTLLSYAKSLGRNTTVTTIANSVVQTSLVQIVVPANSIALGESVQIAALLTWFQATGVAQNEPTFLAFLGPSNVGHVGNTTAFASNATSRRIKLDFNVENTGGGLPGTFTGFYTVQEAGAAGVAPIISKQVSQDLAVNWTIDNTFEIKVTNTIANVNYSTSHKYSFLTKL